MAMRVELDQKTITGYYKRIALDSGDGFVLDFRRFGARPEDRTETFFNRGSWSWLATPGAGAGAKVRIGFAFKPDFVDSEAFVPRSEAGDAFDATGQISVRTGRMEVDRITAMKFEAIASNAVIEVSTPGPCEVRAL